MPSATSTDALLPRLLEAVQPARPNRALEIASVVSGYSIQTGVIFFFTLAEGGSAERLPLITIPAQQPDQPIREETPS